MLAPRRREPPERDRAAAQTRRGATRAARGVTIDRSTSHAKQLWLPLAPWRRGRRLRAGGREGRQAAARADDGERGGVSCGRRRRAGQMVASARPTERAAARGDRHRRARSRRELARQLLARCAAVWNTLRPGPRRPIQSTVHPRVRPRDSEVVTLGHARSTTRISWLTRRCSWCRSGWRASSASAVTASPAGTTTCPEKIYGALRREPVPSCERIYRPATLVRFPDREGRSGCSAASTTR